MTDTLTKQSEPVDQNHQIEIPLTMEFANDPKGYKEAIYEILYEAMIQQPHAITSENIRVELRNRIKNGEFNAEPASIQQVASFLTQIESVLILKGLSIVTHDKEIIATNTRVSLYRLRRLDENTHNLDDKPKEEEDTEINKVKYITSIKHIFSHNRAGYPLIIEIAKRKGITLEDLRDILGYDEISPVLEKINSLGSSSELPQRFKIQAIGKKYFLVIFKPHQQEKQIPPYEPKIIPELLAVETATIFGIKRKVQQLIQQTLQNAAILEKTSLRGKSQADVLRAQKQTALMISSKIKDIIKTLDHLSTEKPTTKTIANQIKEKLEAIIGKYEDSKATEFPHGLRRELHNI